MREQKGSRPSKVGRNKNPKKPKDMGRGDFRDELCTLLDSNSRRLIVKRGSPPARDILPTRLKGMRVRRKDFFFGLSKKRSSGTRMIGPAQSRSTAPPDTINCTPKRNCQFILSLSRSTLRDGGRPPDANPPTVRCPKPRLAPPTRPRNHR